MVRKNISIGFIIAGVVLMLVGFGVSVIFRKPIDASSALQRSIVTQSQKNQSCELPFVHTHIRATTTNQLNVTTTVLNCTSRKMDTDTLLVDISSAESNTQRKAVGDKVQRSIDELVSAAKVAMSRKAYDKALLSLREALSVTADPDERMRLGQMLYECLIRTHAYNDALALGRELLALNPSPQEKLLLTQQLAALLHRMGKSTEAEQFLRSAIETEQDANTKERLQAQLRGIWRHTEGRTTEVVSDLRAKLEQDPQDEQTLRSLGKIYLKSRRDYEAAQPIYEQLAELNPEDEQTQSTLLGIYRKTQNFDGMKRVYETRLNQAGGKDSTLRLSIAQTELMAGRGDEAVAYAEEHLAGEDATSFELQMLSTVYNKAGRKDAAVSTLDSAIARSTNLQERVSMQFQKADMLIWDKKYPDAESQLRAIIQTAGDDKQTITRAKSEIIRIYETQGRLSELNL